MAGWLLFGGLRGSFNIHRQDIAIDGYSESAAFKLALAERSGCCAREKAAQRRVSGLTMAAISLHGTAPAWLGASP